MPNGTPRKLCDVTRLKNLGFIAKTDFRDGIEKAYNDFINYHYYINELGAK